MNANDFPTVAEVASALENVKMWLSDVEPDEEGDAYIDVRLQVTEDGGWDVLSGDASYDNDHNGFWGSGSVSEGTDCEELAAELIDEAQDDAHQCGHLKEDNLHINPDLSN